MWCLEDLQTFWNLEGSFGNIELLSQSHKQPSSKVLDHNSSSPFDSASICQLHSPKPKALAAHPWRRPGCPSVIPVGLRIKCTPLARLRRPCRFCMLPGCRLPVTTISTPGSTSCHYSTARILPMATYLPSTPLHLQDLMSYFSGNSLDMCTLESLLQHPRLH